MREPYRKVKLPAAALLVVMLFALFFPTRAAATGETLTVAYIDYNHFIERQPDGSCTGYGADYLAKIAQYTHWQYDFVDMDWPTAFEAVKAGTVDFFCVARSTPEREAEFDFSLYPVCNEEMNLYTLPDKALYFEDFSAFDTMRFGVLENSNELACFRDYAQKHGFSCNVTEYPSNAAATAALERGEVDAVALVKYSVSGDYKLIGNFGVSPAYVMGCDKSPYMEAFNQAQEALYYDEPNFTKELEEQYYGDFHHSDDLLLTREEAEFIAETPVINVTLSADMAPIEYYDEDTGEFHGVTVDLYHRLSELTGLRFHFLKRGATAQLAEQMGTGAAQMTGALAKNNYVQQELRLRQTKSFAESSFSVITRDYSALTADSVAAIPAGYPMFNRFAEASGYTNLREYPTMDACIRAVRDGEADLTVMITMCDNYLLDHADYKQLHALPIGGSNYEICLGVSVDPRFDYLASIVDKYLSAISSREISDIIVSNTAAAKPEQTFTDWVSDNRWFLIGAVFFVIAVAVLLSIRALRAGQRRAINEKLREQHGFLRHLYDTVPCGIFQYSYEAPHIILNSNAACNKIYGWEDTFSPVGKKPDVVVKAGTEEDFAEKFRLCEQTQGPILYIWPIIRADGTESYAECVMDIVDTEHGKVFQEVFVDVTERVLNEQLVQKRYLREQSKGGDKSLLYTACFDVTEQRLAETTIDVPGIHAGMCVSEFVQTLLPELSELQTEAQIADFRTRFTAERLQRCYEDGQFQDSFDLCRRKDGQFQWLRSELSLQHNPQTGHLMCFDYIRDVTDERVTGDVMRLLALHNCEAFLCVDTASGRCLEYAVAKDGALTKTVTQYGQTDLVGTLATQIKADARDAFLQETAADHICECLLTESRYAVFATIFDADGQRKDVSLTFFYIDRAHGMIAGTVSDVTEVRSAEVRQAKLLADALSAAEKADAAKSQFLSRVSHEMRTPLNAIIGFIELAKSAPVAELPNYLASSGIAAKQLLSVINDVLDVSAIESGKMVIASAPFNFKSLLSAITNLYGTQCRQKGVQFETRMKSVTADWLIGDELRLNQILMNLLGNAVKFTTTGHVWLTVSQTSVEADRQFFRFEISDTGCGMSEQMLRRLFRPFEQESATTAQKYGGSGLGLSIVKNLVSLMNGSIRVESKQGEGSTFIVDLPFVGGSLTGETPPKVNVQSLRILAVDDNAAEREYISAILQRMEIRFDCAESGSKAIAALENAKNQGDPYTMCLVDWRMPEMNGEETTRQIREKFGQDVLVIVVSAYDFEQVGQAAKKAGANLFLSKPVFQSSLFDLFMTLTDGQVAKVLPQKKKWNFSGRRVLLVEDNTLNQIVAKGYLAKNNILVELAEDGRQAVEMFTASAPGYYDAILMDIQMPVMDGLEAAKVIRESDHPEAKTVQMIAQTADAFNEDIAKALAYGMNAHVAKPIDPDMLSQALADAFAKKDKHP